MELFISKENSLISPDGRLAVYIGPDPTMGNDGADWMAVIPARKNNAGEWEQASAWVDTWNPPSTFGWHATGVHRNFEMWAEFLLNLCEKRLAFLQGKDTFPQLLLPDDTPDPGPWTAVKQWFLTSFHIGDDGFLAIGAAPVPTPVPVPDPIPTPTPTPTPTPAPNGAFYLDYRRRIFDVVPHVVDVGRDLRTGLPIVRVRVGDGPWETWGKVA